MCPIPSHSTQRDPELLSPAGNWDCARAAVANGADAIFFGLPKFNARLRADNFTHEDLPELMAFLHAHGVRGFVTMNTLIFTGELEAAEAQLRHLESSGVDAIIVQDLGLAKLARHVAPELEIHASTQMTITSPEGLEFIDSLFTLERAVLSRELSLREIKKFSPKDCVPLEVFVHGALCVAYSGQCLTSESLGQRSANRGECAQACRMPYELVVDGETKDMGEVRYLLSPQDLAAVDLIPELVEQGVVSYKIEGRLKSPEYVAAVTRVYRKAIDDAVAKRESTVTTRERYAMEMTFSRGLTNGWLEGTNHPKLTHGKFGKKRGHYCGEITMCGNGWIELAEVSSIPLAAGDGVVFDAGEDRNEEQGGRVWKREGSRILFHRKHSQIDWNRVHPTIKVWKTDDPKLNAEVRALWKSAKLEPVKKALSITVSGALHTPLTLSCQGVHVESAQALQKANNRPLTTETLHHQLSRLGQTDYTLETLNNELPEGLIVPLSTLNRLRRSLIEAIEQAQETQQDQQAQQGGGTQHTSADSTNSADSKVTRSLTDLLPTPPSRPQVHSPRLSALCRHPHQIEAALEAGVSRIYADFEEIKRYKEAVEIVRHHGDSASIHLSTPRIQKPQETGFFKLIERASPDGILIRNLGAIDYFKNHDGLYKTGDFSLNCANPITASILKEQGQLDHLTISYDLNIHQVLSLLSQAPPEWFEITLHQHMPMFHMEHCVFCTFLSEGTDYTNCGRPCETHSVQLRDRVGQLHTLMADVGCRNTLFNGRAQTGARFYEQLATQGLEKFRIDFTNESNTETLLTLQSYQQLVRGQTKGEALWSDLGALDRLGVVEGTLELK